VFHLPGETLTCTDAVSHYIPTKTDCRPINVRPYRLPDKHKQEVDRQINEMLENNLIRRSKSQWNAPLLVVPKKLDASGVPKLRVVIDFRKLNDVTIGDSFPLPNITDILDQLGNAKYFSTLDLASGYHQIPMAEQDKQKTAFSTSYGHFEYNRMPFGLKNAPATFQRLMNTVLVGMQGIKCFVYLDDIVIYGASLEEHNRRLTEVLERLRKNKLKLQPDKCEFLRKEVTYLGHIVTENGIRPDPSKITAVKNFPVPTKLKEVQAFIGLAGYYRKFIDNFSKIAKPLTLLTRKESTFAWNEEQQRAFEILKEKLITAPVLIYPDFNRKFVVTTDASGYAIGAVLSQGDAGKEKPVAYASRVLNKAERNYSTTEKELLAIVWAVNHFRPYLYGTKFKIITDHKALVWLFNIKDPGSRLIRWRLKLEEYDYEIVHKRGKANANADALSRHPVDDTLQVKALHASEANETENIAYVSETEDDASASEIDESTREIERADNASKETKERNTLTQEDTSKEEKEYTEKEKQTILYEYHDTPIGGHQGIERTIKRIKLLHDWPNLAKDVEKYIKKCTLCQRNKLSRKIKMPLVLTDTPDKPFKKCALDIVGPLPISNNGNKYLLTFQDNLTKFSKAIPIANQEANTVAKEFATKIICEYGIPEIILTDQGTNFVSDIFKNTCKLLKISKIQTTAYHPQSNGALERSHRTLVEYIRHFINDEQSDWDEWVPYAMFAYNTTPHTATGFTPFELVYGRQAELPTTLSKAPAMHYNIEDYAQELKERIRAANKIARENVKIEKEKAKKQYDKRTHIAKFRVGDQVLLYDETVRRGRAKKLEALWIGPYVIIKKLSDVTYAVKKGRRTMQVHANRIKHYIEN